MSLDPSNSDQLEETLESTRRGLRKLEIDTYRLRTDLTRLEAVLEDGTAIDDSEARSRDELPRLSRPKSRARTHVGDSVPQANPQKTEDTDSAADSVIEFDWQPPTPALADRIIEPDSESPQPFFEATDDAEPSDAELSPAAMLANRQRPTYRNTTPPVMASLLLHGAILLMIVSITVATIAHDEQPFTTTLVDLGAKLPEPVQLESFDLGQIAQLDETNLQAASADAQQLDFAGPLVSDVTPVDFESAAGPTSLGDIGAVTALKPLETDLGTIAQPGNGGLGPDGADAPSGRGTGKQQRGGGGKRGEQPIGSAMFFGTKSKGDRFVFVVDNSSSMKNGRLEMAIAELVKTVYSLSIKQSFYVIFVSDQTYPMFFPNQELDMVPATPLNKKRLTDWLPKAILASGKNRELIKAMDMAAALNPHAVYLLWDGDMRYSDTVRLDVMTHLTAPNQWNFTVHTLGLGVTAIDAEQNLTSIAQAHGGLYRRIDVPSARKK